MNKILLLFTILCLSSCSKSYRLKKIIKEFQPGPPFDCRDNKNIYAPHRFIAHAGGEIDGHIYTNSLEGLYSSRNKGYKLLEIDMQVTKDNKIIGLHSWDDLKKLTGFNEKITSKTFEKRKILNKYTTLTIERINSFFEKHQEMFLITDKIKDLELLNSSISIKKDRIFIETFSINDYGNALELGFPFPALSLGSGDNINIINALLEQPVPLLFVSVKSIIQYPTEFMKLQQKGVCIYTFTVNNHETIKKFIGTNAFGIYSDFWHVKKKAILKQ